MNAIEELRRARHVDPPDLEVIEAARQAVGLALEAGHAPTRRCTEMGTGPSRHRVRRGSATSSRAARRAGMIAAVAAVVIAIAVVVVVVVVGFAPVRPGPGSSAPKAAQAARVRAELASAVQAATPQSTLPPLGPGQYYYQRDVVTSTCTFPLGTSPNAALVSYHYLYAVSEWTLANGAGQKDVTPLPGGQFVRAATQAAWQAAGSPPILCIPGSESSTQPAIDTGILSLAGDATALGALISSGRVLGTGHLVPASGKCAGATPLQTPGPADGQVCSASEELTIIDGLLSFPTASVRLGPVLYRIWEGLPGLRSGAGTDALGRSGTLFQDAAGNGLLVTPATGALLASETFDPPGTRSSDSSNPLVHVMPSVKLPPGAVFSEETYGPLSVVDGIGKVPS